MSWFVVNQNILRFEDQFRSETDLAKKQLLRKLLIEEVDRFAARSERLQVTEQHIVACTAYISEQEARVERLNGHGDPAQITEAKRLLNNLLELRAIYTGMRKVCADGLDRSLT